MQTLTRITQDDLMAAMGLPTWCQPALRGLFAPFARRFARQMLAFDAQVGRDGLASASAGLLAQLSGGLLPVEGAVHLPAQGPLLVLANHPGMTDTLALFATLSQRIDWRIIAMDRPFLRALPHVASRLILVPSDESQRLAVLRQATRNLQQGGAVLTFPAGQIEPDPAVDGAVAAHAASLNWSDSPAILLRRVPHTALACAVVSQVISSQARQHPLTRCRATLADREQLAAALQLMWRPYQRGPVRVQVGMVPWPPVAGEPDAIVLRAAVQARLHALLST
jgi:hypothetical protein